MTVPGGLRSSSADPPSPRSSMGARSDSATTPQPVREHDQSPEVSDLLARAAAGDEAAWRGIVSIYARRVFALARSRRLSDDTAEEVAQSVFVTVASQLGSGKYSERGRFESWLFRVAINRVRDEIRRAARHAGAADPVTLDARAAEAAPAPDDSADREVAMLRRAMAGLSDADREIVDLRHHAGLSFKQISDLLGEPLGTLLARHHRALRKLRDSIESDAAGAKGTDR